MKNFGFTLIELLVVISIIAVMAGIALPVFQKAQERARATQDASNLRQVGIGLIAYFSDNDDTMSAALETTWPGTGAAGSVGLNPKYVGASKAFNSPFDKRGESPSYCSYGLNTRLFDPVSPSTTRAANMGSLVSSSATLMLAPSYAGDPQAAASWTGTPAAAVNVTQAAPTRGTHSNGGRINVVFCDSHVEAIKFQGTAAVPDGYKKPVTDRLWSPY